MSKQTWLSTLEFTLINFATPIAFYVTFRIAGPKPAIALAIATTGIQALVHKIRGLKMGPFFLLASGFTVFFGSIDLVVASPRFFRLEPAVHNFVVGVVFLYSAFTHRPLVAWFAEAVPERFRPSIAELGPGYLRGVTVYWAAYLLAKAGVYLYLAFKVDLGTLIVLRSVIGGSSLGAMVLAEIAYRKWVRPPRR
jgi:intracellular septation protein A